MRHFFVLVKIVVVFFVEVVRERRLGIGIFQSFVGMGIRNFVSKIIWNLPRIAPGIRLGIFGFLVGIKKEIQVERIC